MSHSGPYFEFTPTTEQEVVMLFGLLLPQLPKRYQINEVRIPYPDCLAYEISDSGEKRLVRIEFELISSNFISHGHDPNQCDLIVCWKDNLASYPIPRLALSSIVKEKPIIEIDKPKYSKQAWDFDSYFADVPEDQLLMQTNLYEWAKTLGSVKFGHGKKSPSWQLSILHPLYGELPVFGVYSNGIAWPGFLTGRVPIEIEKDYREYFSKNTTETEKSLTGDYINLDLTTQGNYDGLVGAILLLINSGLT